jgi:superfamily I DNA/RNA helicase
VREGVVFGPPGTGKTTWGIDMVRRWLAGGAHPDEVAYLAFTRAAAKEAARRIIGQASQDAPRTIVAGSDDPNLEYPYFRTIHSLCWRTMKEQRSGVKILKPADMTEFAKKTGFDGTYAVPEWEDIGDAFGIVHGVARTHWDRVHQAYQYARVCSGSAEELDAARLGMGIAGRIVGMLGDLGTDAYRTFVKRYEAFKTANGLVDFTDMLEWALRDSEPLPIRFLLVDEAQDLCPLHYAVLDRMFSGCEEIWWVGDDDQSIYSFAGASAKLFLDRARASSIRMKLRDTHRFGQTVVDFSARIIRRIHDRMEKGVRGDPKKSSHITVAGMLEPFIGDALVLHRHVVGCRTLASRWEAAGLPYRNERGRDPLGSALRVGAYETLNLLATGRSASASVIESAIHELVPSVVADGDRKIRLVVHGAKKKMQEGGTRESAGLSDLQSGGILTPEGAEAIRSRKWGLMRHQDDLGYYDRLTKGGHSLSGFGCPVITTIHGSKGRQAQRVAVMSEMGHRCWDDTDTEHRLAYVASTRTQRDLLICDERTVEWAADQYDYPSVR